MEKCASKYCGCLYYSANALSRVITKMAEQEFAFTGMAPSYAFIVMSVYEKPGIQPTEISKQMQLKPSTITRLIEKLEFRKLLERKVVGKFTEVHPTEQTEEMYKNIKQAWKNLYKRYSEILGEQEGKQLVNLINEAAAKLEK